MVWRPPRIDPNYYGDDHRPRRLPPRRPDDRADMRQGMGYRESFLQQAPQNQSPSTSRAENAECYDSELEDDVFVPRQTPRRSSGAARNYEPRTFTPNYARARTYNSQEKPSRSSSLGPSSSGSSDRYKCGQEMNGRQPPMDTTDCEYSTSTERTLPSWPNTPSPIKDTTRRSPYLETFNIHSPPWDFERRQSTPGRPSRMISMPEVPGSVSGQPRSGPTLSWTATPDGRPSVALNYLDAQDNPTSIQGLTADTYNKFLKQQDLALVMFYNSGHISSGSLQDWVNRNFVKAAQLTGGSSQTFAAVDCAKETDLCASQQINTFPFFKLYSKGYLMKHVTDFASLVKGR